MSKFKYSIMGFIVGACLIGFTPAPAKAEVYNSDLISNGGFEDGLTGWDCANCDIDDIIDYSVYSGDYSFWLGGYNEKETLSQTVQIPTDARLVTLKFAFDYNTDIIYAGDSYFEFLIIDADSGEIYHQENLYRWDAESVDWDVVSYNLDNYAGRNLNVSFSVYNSDSQSRLTYMLLDSISLIVKSASTLDGKVVNQNAKPIKKAKVIIKNNSGRVMWSGKTGSDGRFFADNLKGGDITILLKKNGETKKIKGSIKYGEAYTDKFKF